MQRPRPIPRQVVLSLASAGVLVLAVFLVIPAIPTPPPGGGGAGACPGLPPGVPMPLTCSSMTSGNAHLGETFGLTVHARAGLFTWILASSNSGPSTIGPFPTDLSPDWFVLQGPVFTGGGNRVDLSFPLPSIPSLVDAEVVLQTFLLDVGAVEMTWTNSLMHRLTVPPPQGRSVCLVRQTLASPEMPNAGVQADALVQLLQLYGHQVTVVDDAVPGDLASYDALFDCRFSVPLIEDDKLAFVRFLQRYGGVFLVCGPWIQSPQAQLRQLGIRDLLNNRLGIGVVVASGGMLSGGASVEQVSPDADPRYLTFPGSVSGLPYHVDQEGGNFGPSGFAPVGTPWIAAAGGWATVFGMLFKPDDVTTLSVKGTMAVLFNGAADALMQTPANPQTGPIFANLPWYLDH